MLITMQQKWIRLLHMHVTRDEMEIFMPVHMQLVNRGHVDYKNVNAICLVCAHDIIL